MAPFGGINRTLIVNSFTEYSVGEGTAARQLTAMPGTIAVGSRLSGDILSSGVSRVR